MTERGEADVLVVGVGPTGLTLAGPLCATCRFSAPSAESAGSSPYTIAAELGEISRFLSPGNPSDRSPFD